MQDAPRPATAGTQSQASDPSGQARTRRGRPLGNHEHKRSELLQAVISVIAHEGYAGTSMRRVAQQAGCTTGAVTYYYANKEEMVTAAAQHLFDEFDALLSEESAGFDMATLIREWLNWTRTDEPDSWLALFQLMAHARHEPAFAEVFQQRYSRFRQVFSGILAKGQREGTIRDDIEASLLADLISAMGDGWMMAKPIEAERFTGARMDALLDAVLTLIAPMPKARC